MSVQVLERTIELDTWLHELVDVLGREALQKGISKLIIIYQLNDLIASIDKQIQEQLDEVLHHSAFQALESSWMGCNYLLEQVGYNYQVKVRLLNVSWAELNRDVTRAIEIDQSEIFNKVYSYEFGIAGGEPFGVMLCNYDISLYPKSSGVDDIRLLKGLAAVAAASFSPFIFNADPSLLDLEKFSMMHSTLNLSRTYQQLNFTKWKALRSIEDARFIGLTLPSLYVRRAYRHNHLRRDQFIYRESVNGPDDYLSFGAVFAFGAVLARCFTNTGWLAEIVGERYFGGGAVPGLSIHKSEVDNQQLIASEVMIPDALERSLTEFGFIPVCYSANSGTGMFYSAPSIQSPAKYTSQQATINARYSAMMQYVLCTSRFAHYLKIIVRDRVGSFSTPEECRNFLQTWIMNYVMATDEASDVLLARYPLRDARVIVTERAGASGSYICTVHLKPHFQLETIETSIQFSAEVVTNRLTG